MAMPGEMPQGTSAQSAESWRPSPHCKLCRLGTVTVPTKPGDVHGWPENVEEVYYEGAPAAPWVKPHRSNVVQGDGPVPCPVMLVGEAPGFHEDRDGLGFRPQAPAGRVLAAALAEVGLRRLPPFESVDPEWAADNFGEPFVYVTNALKCRPVDNKIDKFLDCLEFCRTTFLDREIEAVNPKVIVFLGKTAAQPSFGKETSLIIRHDGGRQLPGTEGPAYRTEGRLLIHAPHPSYIARGAVEARVLLIEALKLAKEVGYGS